MTYAMTAMACSPVSLISSMDSQRCVRSSQRSGFNPKPVLITDNLNLFMLKPKTKFKRTCMENHSTMAGCQEFLFSYKSFKFFTVVTIASFEIYRCKFTGYLILICSVSS